MHYTSSRARTHVRYDSANDDLEGAANGRSLQDQGLIVGAHRLLSRPCW